MRARKPRARCPPASAGGLRSPASLLAAAPLWILDEPYTNLDAAGTERVSAVIGRHLDAGGAALIAAHQPPANPQPRAPPPGACVTARTGMLAAAALAFRRDILLALRHWGQVAQPLVFFVMVATLFPLALGPELAQLREIAAGMLWVAALLASLLALEFLFRADHADGTLEQLLLSGQPLAILALAKGVAHWAVCGLPLVLLAPLVAVGLGVPAGASCTIMLSLGLGTGILSALGAIGSALTLGVRRGSLLLALLVLPLAMPALIFGARAIDLAVHGDSARGPLLLLSAMLALGVTLAPPAVAAALRISSE